MISHNFCGSGIFEWLGWAILVWGLWCGLQSGVAWGFIHLKAGLALEDLLPGCLTDMASKWYFSMWPFHWNA